MLSYLPSPTRDVSNGSATTSTPSREINDRAMMYTGKVDHRFTDKVSLTGFYLYNKTDEPCANSGVPRPERAEPRSSIRSDYLLIRRVHVLALNNTWLPGNNTVFDAALRLDRVPATTTRCRSTTTRRSSASASRS